MSMSLSALIEFRIAGNCRGVDILKNEQTNAKKTFKFQIQI